MSVSECSEVFGVFNREAIVNDRILTAIAECDAEAFQRAFQKHWRKPLRRMRQFGLRPLMECLSEAQRDRNDREQQLSESLKDLESSSRGKKARREKVGKKKGHRETDAPSTPMDLTQILRHWVSETADPLGTRERLIVAEILFREHENLPADLFVQCVSGLIADQNTFSPEPTVSKKGKGTSPAVNQADLKKERLLHFQFEEEEEHSGSEIRPSECDWILGLLFEPLNPEAWQNLRQAALSELARTITECLDSAGVLHGSLIAHPDRWLSPIVRTAAWARVFQETAFDGETIERLEAGLNTLSLMILPDGSSLFAERRKVNSESGSELLQELSDDCPEDNSGEAPSNSGIRNADAESVSLRELLLRTIELCGLKPEGHLLRRLRREDSCRVSKRERREFLRTQVPRKNASRKPSAETCIQSDEACVAIMRSSRHALADCCILDWHSTEPVLSLAAGGIPVLQGPWNLNLEINGTPAPADYTWACTCWFLDEEAAFVELEAQGTAGFRLIRQLLLLRCEHTLMLTDSVRAHESSDAIRYSSTVRSAAGIISEPDDVTRQVTGVGEQISLRGYPLWLPDDRLVSSGLTTGYGSLMFDRGEWKSSAEGVGGLTVPLVFDWNSRRDAKKADWNRLTVAERRKNLTPREAAGFRLRIGKTQWLMYRSLSNPEVARTVLGLHTGDETYIGTVSSAGEIEPILLVEMSAASG